MKPGELLRVRVAFGALGCVPVFLAGYLGYVQVAQAGTVARRSGEPLPLVAQTADRQGWRTKSVPSPRGSIVDRNGNTLAADCENYEVRARIVVPSNLRRDVVAFRAWMADLVDDLALALVADPDLPNRGQRHRVHRDRLAGLLAHDWHVDRLPATGAFPKKHSGLVDILVSGGVDRLAAIVALRRLGERKPYRSVRLDFLHSFRRVYPDRDLTHGIVGHCESVWQAATDGGRKQLRTFGVCGLESFAALDAGSPARRRFLADGKGRPYFVAPVEHPPIDTVLHTTLDLELQRVAVRELTEQAEKGTRTDKSARPKWGALVLIDIHNGDVLASASWHRDVKHPKEASYTPYQSLFEPGSIVKPLVLAYAHEVGALDWSHVYDCGPGSADYRQRIAGLGRSRPVSDDHHCGELTPHGILVNSSNIGASYVGLQLSREQWQDYMRGYGIGTSLLLNLPNESRGGTNRRSFASDVTLRSFRANSAISFSFGYEHMVTPLQMARAYLRLFRGLGAELRLCRGLEIGSEWYAVEPKPDTSPHYRPAVVEAVRQALTDVVSDDPKATGHFLHRRMLDETGIDLHGLIGGKTGTSASRVGLRDGTKINARNASFVGFLPAEAPRWLVVCVLQKDDSASFYGGSYAAPPAVRLLLQCQKLAERRQLHQEPQRGSGGQTRIGNATPGSSGWISTAGAEGSRDTR